MASTDLGGTTIVDDPTDLTREEYIAALKRTMKEVKEDDAPGLAGGVAFKIFLSIFPSLLAAVAVFSLVTTPAEISDLVSELNGILPEEAIRLLQAPLNDLVETKTTVAGLAAVVGVVTGLIAAMSAAMSLMKALSRAYDVAETRKFVRQRVVALALVLALILALVAIVLLLVAGPQVQESLIPGVPPPLDWLLIAARYALALVVLVLLFAFVYWIGPNRDHPSWVWMSPGAVIGVLGWLAVAGGFTLYAQTFGTYGKTYGTIAGVVVLLIWLQLSMLVMLIGAEFNAEIERTRAVQVRVAEGAGFAVPAPAAALGPGGAATAAGIREAEVAAPTLVVPPTQGPTHSPAGAPLAVGPPAEVPARALARPGGALVVAVMALAILLGFAKRRSRS